MQTHHPVHQSSPDFTINETTFTACHCCLAWVLPIKDRSTVHTDGDAAKVSSAEKVSIGAVVDASCRRSNSRNRRKVTHLVWMRGRRQIHQDWITVIGIVWSSASLPSSSPSTSLRPIGLKRMLRNKICKFAISVPSGVMERQEAAEGFSVGYDGAWWRGRNSETPVKRMRRRWSELHRINAARNVVGEIFLLQQPY